MRKPQHKKRRPPLHQSDRKLRERLALAYAYPETTPANGHIENLGRLFDWIKSGDLPAGEARRATLKAVESNKAS
jgi:hypothetical protein